jgi:glycosyltransferase involved in cell wall biosynthesis
MMTSSFNDCNIAYLFLSNWPSVNSGGPRTVGRILAEEIIKNGGDIEVGGRRIPIRLIVGYKVYPLSALAAVTARKTKISLLDRLRDKLGRILVRRPDLRSLAALELLWCRTRKCLLLRNVRRDCRGKTPLVLAFDLHGVYLLAPYKKALGGVLVHTEHSKGGVYRELVTAFPKLAGNSYLRTLRRREIETILMADFVVFPSRGARELFFDTYPDVRSTCESKCRVLYNAIPDWLAFLSVPSVEGPAAWEESGRRAALNVAAHVREKRVDLFVEGFSGFYRALPANDRERYVAVNYGAHSFLTREIVNKARQTVGSVAEFGGVISHAELLRKLLQCWVFVSVPDVAVFDLALLEAMCLEKPAIATRTGGNIEALGNDYPLFVRDAGELSEKLNYLYNYPDVARAIGRRNRARFLSHFSTGNQLKALQEMLAEIASPSDGNR